MEQAIWSFIPVSDFALPASPARDVARGRLRRFWNYLRSSRSPTVPKPESEEAHGDRPSADRLQAITPVPDWQSAAAALAELVEDLLVEPHQPGRTTIPLIGPPGCDVAAILRMLAQNRGDEMLAAPSAADILDTTLQEAKALREVEIATDADALLVVPNLEHWYLRHESGLLLIRRLMEQLVTCGRRVLVGCDSWAWAFLQHAVGVEDVLGPPRTLAPFHAERLDALLRAHLELSNCSFRRSDGKPVFPSRESSNGDASSEVETSSWLKSLAARARGNLGVALAVWRASLRLQPDESGDGAPAGDGSVYSVVEPADLMLPHLPVNVQRVYRLTLHTLLLHGGLTLPTLSRLLPFSSAHVTRCVTYMRQADILAVGDDERIRVRLAAYPFVRHLLHSDGLLTDAF